ncbi:MAG: hypothetical protein LBQ66_13490 [Planctomycetaceae bacterium]|nr:hypothetical protein [Planctomycetaceae bacterium]
MEFLLAKKPHFGISTRFTPLRDEGKPRPYNIGHFGFADACSAPVVGLRRRNRPAVGYPPYVLQHVLAFLPNLFGFLMHLGGRDARVSVRAASRQTFVLYRAYPFRCLMPQAFTPNASPA